MLDAAARLAMHRRDHARAALLLGAADQLRETLGVPVWGSQQARRQELVDAVRSSLGDEAYESATAEGRALGYDDALDAAAVPATEAVGGGAQEGI